MAEPLIEHPPRQDIIQLRQLMKETPDFPGITLTFPFPLSEDRQHALSALKTGVLPAGKESLFTHPDFVVQQAAHFTEAHGNVPIPLEPFTWLLLSRKAALATPFRENIASKIKGLANLMQEATTSDQRIIGLAIYGSFDKGYATPESDLDCTLIVKTPNSEQDAELLKKIRAFSENEFDRKTFALSDRKNTALINPLGDAAIFTGSFFGDAKRLQGVQRELLLHIQPRWEQMRRTLADQVTINKAFERNYPSITPIQTEFASHWLKLLRVPPQFEESLQFLTKK